MICIVREQLFLAWIEMAEWQSFSRQARLSRKTMTPFDYLEQSHCFFKSQEHEAWRCITRPEQADACPQHSDCAYDRRFRSDLLPPT